MGQLYTALGNGLDYKICKVPPNPIILCPQFHLEISSYFYIINPLLQQKEEKNPLHRYSKNSLNLYFWVTQAGKHKCLRINQELLLLLYMSLIWSLGIKALLPQSSASGFTQELFKEKNQLYSKFFLLCCCLIQASLFFYMSQLRIELWEGNKINLDFFASVLRVKYEIYSGTEQIGFCIYWGFFCAGKTKWSWIFSLNHIFIYYKKLK